MAIHHKLREPQHQMKISDRESPVPQVSGWRIAEQKRLEESDIVYSDLSDCDDGGGGG
jgi:hypothetical protein